MSYESTNHSALSNSKKAMWSPCTVSHFTYLLDCLHAGVAFFHSLALFSLSLWRGSQHRNIFCLFFHQSPSTFSYTHMPQNTWKPNQVTAKWNYSCEPDVRITQIHIQYLSNLMQKSSQEYKQEIHWLLRNNPAQTYKGISQAPLSASLLFLSWEASGFFKCPRKSNSLSPKVSALVLMCIYVHTWKEVTASTLSAQVTLKYWQHCGCLSSQRLQ